jgi:hypothetical protein
MIAFLPVGAGNLPEIGPRIKPAIEQIGVLAPRRPDGTLAGGRPAFYLADSLSIDCR